MSENDLMVQCGRCGKSINPMTSYYLARRSKVLANVDGWDYFGISPVFYACSYQHFAMLITSHALEMREAGDEQLSITPDFKGKGKDD